MINMLSVAIFAIFAGLIFANSPGDPPPFSWVSDDLGLIDPVPEDMASGDMASGDMASDDPAPIDPAPIDPVTEDMASGDMASDDPALIDPAPGVLDNIFHNKKCWTQYFDRDDPTGRGDYEDLYRLRKLNPGKICRHPLAIQAEALSGVSADATGDVLYKNDRYSGLICRNRDQYKWRRCHDYRVRFQCPLSHCEVKVCWTKYFDQDNPTGRGDYELLHQIRKTYPGQICRHPSAIEAVTTDTHTPASSTGDNIYLSSPTKGFVCRNRDQKWSGWCRDYKHHECRGWCRDYKDHECHGWCRDNNNHTCRGWWCRYNNDHKCHGWCRDNNNHKCRGWCRDNEDHKCDGWCRDYKVRFACPCRRHYY